MAINCLVLGYRECADLMKKRHTAELEYEKKNELEEAKKEA